MQIFSRFSKSGDLVPVRLLESTTLKAFPRAGAVIFDDSSTLRPVRQFRPIYAEFHAVSAWVVKNAVLACAYVVHKDDRLYIDGSIDSGAFWGGREANVSAQFLAMLENKKRIMDPVYKDHSALVMHNEGGGTWGHFLLQNVPRAALYSRAFPDGYIAIPASQCTQDSPFAQALESVGIKRSRLLPLVDGFEYSFAELTFVDPVYNFDSHVAHPFTLELLAEVGAGVTAATDASTIFIERVGTEAGRQIGNMSEVDAILSGRNVKTIRTGDQPLIRQIASWRGVRTAIGVLGSDFTNLVFAQPGSDVVVLSPDWFGDAFFYNLAAAKGVRWNELRCGRLLERATIDHRSSFAVDPVLLDVILGSL